MNEYKPFCSTTDEYECKSSWIIGLIRHLRPELCHKFPIKNQLDIDKFEGWLVTSGILEYSALLEDNDFKKSLTKFDQNTELTRLQLLIYCVRSDIQHAYPLPKNHHQFLIWFYKYGIKEHNLWAFLSIKEQQRLLNLDKHLVKPKVETIPSKFPFGVNLIGYAHGQLGIGEDLRMAAKSLKAIDTPFSVLNFPPGKDIPQNDESMLPYIKENAPYAINLFCLTPLEHARFYAERGKKLIEGRYNIGYWPWELSQWPKDWLTLTCLVDEVWVSTQHIYDALSPVSPVPVLIMPMTVELGGISTKKRHDFGLPEDDKLFCFSFDLNSSIHRKNPQACINTFLQAFPLTKQSLLNEEKVGLVIKVHPPKGKNEEWENLKKLAKRDKRIYIVEETLSRPDLLALYQSCDCFLSLHRAEGFGRGIAEAMQLGLHIITTGYSGNVDFCQNNLSQIDLVNYRLIPVNEGEYPYFKNQVWADIKMSHAIQLMKKFVIKNQCKRNRNLTHFSNFNAKIVGKRYKDRFNIIRSWMENKAQKN